MICVTESNVVASSEYERLCRAPTAILPPHFNVLRKTNSIRTSSTKCLRLILTRVGCNHPIMISVCKHGSSSSRRPSSWLRSYRIAKGSLNPQPRTEEQPHLETRISTRAYCINVRRTLICRFIRHRNRTSASLVKARPRLLVVPKRQFLSPDQDTCQRHPSHRSTTVHIASGPQHANSRIAGLQW
jgi:hypothetical protein